MKIIFTSLKLIWSKLTFLIFTFLFGHMGYSQCNQTISLYDSWGDGWNGATITVNVNGSPVLSNITLASGSGPANFTFSASTGDAIQVVVTATGGFLDECYFDVRDVNSDLLVNDWQPYWDGTWNGTANCNVIMKVPTSGNNSYTTCSGNLYDNGGPSGNYGNSWNGYTVLYPVVGTDKVRISGTTDGENCCDYVRIYNGVGTGGTVLGTYYMDAAIPILTSTDATGALTVRFVSDFGTVGTGFNISISCFTPCATVAGTSSASVTSGCGNTSTTLSLAGEGAGTIQWQQSTDGGATWNNIAGAITDPYVYSSSVTRLFRAAVTSGCTSYSTTSSYTASCPDIIHPASGFATSTIQCGGSYTYRDPGNTGNYSNDQNGLITICPSIAGRYVSVNFTSFNTESGFDYIYVFDGDWAGAPILGIYSGTSLSGVVKATASNSSGCLSFRFTSDGGTTSSGWQATVTCASTPSATVPSSNPEDCQGAIVVCSNSSLVGGTNNYGFQELPYQWNSCLGFDEDPGEYESTWYVFSSTTNGTIGFEISPTVPADYDWTVWGPYSSLQCPAYTNDVPIRCSSSSLDNSDGGSGTTGLIAPATDVIEQNGEYGGGEGQFGGTEDGALAPLNVLAGEVYVMMLDNWDANTTTFSLNWTLTNGAILDCTPALPITLSSLNNSCFKGQTLIEWSTATETNNDYFAIEKSDATFNFIEIGRIIGAGNSNINQNYSFTDPTFNDKTTYYRIKQVDYNGEHTYYRVLASNCFNKEFEVVNTQLNSNNLDLIINSFENENIIVYLYDIHGKLIVQENKTLGVGNNKLNVSQFNISSGVYLISIVGEVHHYQSKLLKR